MRGRSTSYPTRSSEPKRYRRASKLRPGPTPAAATQAGTCTRGTQASKHTYDNHNRTRCKRTDQTKENSMHYMGGSTFRRRGMKQREKTWTPQAQHNHPARTPPHDTSTQHSKQETENKNKKSQSADRDYDRRRKNEKEAQDRRKKTGKTGRKGGHSDPRNHT